MRSPYFRAVNIAVPLIIGGAIYVLCSPDAYFVRLLSLPAYDLPIPKPIRNYLCDFLWAYALTFAVTPLVGEGRSHVLASFALCAGASVILELLQKLPNVMGTFDRADIVTEIFACITACIIISVRKKEKQ